MFSYKLTWVGIAAVILMGGILSAGYGGGDFWTGWLAYVVLLALSVLSLAIIWRLVIGKRLVRGLLMACVIAFLLRLSLGATLTQVLPLVGYANSQEHQSGYAFTDARIRDQQAWELATSGKPLSLAFSGKYSGDQYGGLLALSALVYRLLSPDFHRQTLILVLTSAVAAWGVIFMWKASQSWLGDQVAGLTAWVLALYPESLLLGGSQMREAFVITAVAMTFYSLTLMRGSVEKAISSNLQHKPMRLAWAGWLLIAAVILFLFQPPIALVSFALLFCLWLLDPKRRTDGKGRRSLWLAVVLGGILLVAVLVVIAVWANLPSLQGTGPLGIFSAWLQRNFEFQSYLTERASGMIQKLFDIVGKQWQWLVILIYGTAQPVLPAMVGDPQAAWIMRTIGLLRAAGWYALAPFLVYSLVATLRARDENRRPQLLFLVLTIFAWTAISALNGGADQWDTPRYRTMLLAWEALLAAWAWVWVRSSRDVWLKRILAVEAAFLLLFTEWYISRYYPGWPHLSIIPMIVLTLAVSAAILAGSWLWDRL